LVNVDPEEIRRWYASLSDEALLSVDHRELTDLAQQVYSQELASRGLQSRPAPNQAVDDQSPLPDLALSANRTSGSRSHIGDFR